VVQYSGTASSQENQLTHVAARPVTPEPTTATRIVSNYRLSTLDWLS
jgi:hypothetical protein